MKPFRFQQFDIDQSSDVFRVGTDAVLLGALSTVANAKQILEVGTGTGIISLMLAQRNRNVNILAIDINSEAVNISQYNFSNSIFSDRIKSQLKDFKDFWTDEKFDLIISNPPYFEINSSGKDILARQRLELDFFDLIRKASQLLYDKGLFSVIIPIDSEKEFAQICSENNLFLQRKVIIKGIKTAEPKRVVLEYSLKKSEIKVENFVIEKSPRVYSDEYLELTKDFHLFNKKPL
ncbi:tRNA1(Val) (adenine(37)-N6)-methyltransferase [Epilithonimonas hungarica]|uniref:tRNA1(Val) (adenine(37)-N6)-methyltransferase n=1 Tax=Epilithonimonas hungarica TaxID=454006 RepID=A0A1G7VG20_9FLAO|nr:methyltransferase [Epilithonimonas hungarica]SDG58521.1 tRNA1Val (adenine37-N6)-methyltransferase [Epilithonimonas hungarica]